MTSNSFKPKIVKLFRSIISFGFVRDLVILVLIITVVSSWQTKDMLSTDGSVYVKQRNLVSLDGQVSKLLSNDKPNLVYFFAPWCTICDISIDNLAYLNREKVNISVVALDYSSIEEVEMFINKNDISVNVLLGNEQLKQEFAIQGYPSYYLIDEQYKINSKSYGYSTAVGLKLRELFGT